MTNYILIKQQADALRLQHNYNAALPLYHQLWNNFADQTNKWDGMWLAYCLKNNKQYTEALNICRAVFAKYSSFKNIHNLYAWCIYFTQLSTPIKQTELAIKAARAIIKLTQQNDIYAPYTNLKYKTDLNIAI